MAIVSGRRAKRPDGGVYRQMRLRRRSRGGFRRRSSRVVLLLVGAVVIAAALYFAWRTFLA